MPRSEARTPDEMIAALPPDRREAISAVRGSSRATRSRAAAGSSQRACATH
jgi:hypothetical protein